MLDDEKTAARREILEHVAALFHEHLEASEWGRLLVHVDLDETGSARVTSLELEDIVGDESKVDRVFHGPTIQQFLPLLAKTTEALTALDGAELEQVGGGTFLRTAAGEFGFLPGLLRVPSTTFENLRDGVATRSKPRQAKLYGDSGVGWAKRYELDLDGATMGFFDDTHTARARVALIGSYSEISRSFMWGWGDATLSEATLAAARAVVDAVPHREMWELTTKQFATDEPTAFQLALLVCDVANGVGVYRVPQAGGVVYLLIENLGSIMAISTS